MGCELVRERLREHLDGRLPPVEARAVETHLSACAACQEEWVLLRQVNDALATLPVLEEPADLAARVMARVRATEANRSPVPSPAFQRWPRLVQVLRWDDAVVSFAFAWAMTMAVFVLSLLGPQQISTARDSLQQAWWAWLPELDGLWHTLQTEPIYAVWGLSSLCVAAAAALTVVALGRQWLQPTA